MKLGDAIATVATPIARALKMHCIDPETHQLRSESTCAKVRDLANQGRYGDAIYERWFKAKQKGEKMEYQIVVVVNADKTSEAAAKAESIGDVVAIKAVPSQQPK